jgi:glycosyltransferase involved in cell wall biosynthesis
MRMASTMDEEGSLGSGKPPHVLMIVSWFGSPSAPATGVFFRDQAEALHRAGSSVGIAHPECRRLRTISARAVVENHWQIVEEHLNGVTTLRLAGWNPGLARLRARAYLAGADRLVDKYVRGFGRPDVLHAQATLWGGVAASHISRRLGIPFVITEHFSGFAGGTLRSWEEPIAMAALQEASAVLAVSTNLARSLRGMVPDLDVKVVPNMVDTEFFSPLPSERPTSPYVFLCVGILVHRKRFDVAIGAFAAAFPDDPGVILRIGGSGPEASSLARLAEQLGVGARVQFLGGLSRVQVRDEMRSADAFVVSSSVETFGVVVAEAQSVGLPAVVTECGGPEEIVSESTGLRVAPDNVAELSRAMREMYGCRTDWASRAGAIRESTRRRFDSAAVAERILSCYEHALS